MKIFLVVISIFFTSFTWAETYEEYYKYAERFFYNNHMMQSFNEQEKDSFCIEMATRLYTSKANLKKLVKEMYDNSAISRFSKVVPYKQEYREWAFVNGKGLLTAIVVDMGTSEMSKGGYTLEDINYKNNYQSIYEGWFKHYITLDALEKKWKNKPSPKGYGDFIKKYRFINF